MANEEKKNQEEKKTLTAQETSLFAFGLIEQKAWISLGLVKDSDNEFHKSEKDARFLIDTLTKMVEAFESHMEQKITDDVRSQVATLQLNFVNQFGKKESPKGTA